MSATLVRDQWTEADRAVVYLRSVAPCGLNQPQRHCVERLETLADAEVLEDVEVTAWSSAVADAGGSCENAVESLVERFEDWATEHDYSLEPALRHVETRSMVEDPCQSVQLPMICVALYEDDSLAAVFPHADGDTVHTVAECLAALEEATDATAPSLSA